MLIQLSMQKAVSSVVRHCCVKRGGRLHQHMLTGLVASSSATKVFTMCYVSGNCQAGLPGRADYGGSL